jgi:hypothetical protein
MADEGQTEQNQTEFVSTYGWLLAPGDHMQADYTSPTAVTEWSQATAFTLPPGDKQKAYGQWMAQLLQNQLGTHPDLVSLYYPPKADGQTQWPFTLRSDVILALDEYFAHHMDQPCPSQ